MITVHHYDGKNVEIKASDESNWSYSTNNVFVIFGVFAELVTLILLF